MNMILSKLNDDIMANVFTFLPFIDTVILRRVNKKWENLFEVASKNRKSLALVPYPRGKCSSHYSVDRRLARRMKITQNDVIGGIYYNLVDENEKYDLLRLAKILDRAPRLQNIEIAYIDEDIIKLLSEKAQNLKFLAFHSVDDNLTKEIIEKYSDLWKKITKIAFGSLVEDREIKIFLKQLKKLEELHFFFSAGKDTSQFPPLRFETLSLVGPKIRKIYLANRPLDLTFVSSGGRRNKILKSDLMKLKEFETLGTIVGNHDNDDEDDGHDDQFLIDFLLRLKGLRTLILNTLIFQENQSFGQLRHLSRLRRLELVNIINGDDLDLLSTFLSNKSNLVSLSLEAGAPHYDHYPVADIIPLIVRKCPKLKHFYLKSLSSKYSKQQCEEFSIVKELQNLHHLESLELPHSDLNEDLFADLVSQCRSVRKFNFTAARKIANMEDFIERIMEIRKNIEINLSKSESNIEVSNEMKERIENHLTNLAGNSTICYCCINPNES